MYRTLILTATLFLLGSPAMSMAQDSNRHAPQAEHEILKRFEGEWTFARTAAATDGSTPEEVGSGRISTELPGGLFLVSRWSGQLYGMDFTGFQAIGYDIDQGAYSGIQIDNFMNYRWQLDGSFAPDGREFTLTAEGPAPDGGTAQFRERYRFDSADAMTVFAEMQQDGEWVAISTTRITRHGTTPETFQESSE